MIATLEHTHQAAQRRLNCESLLALQGDQKVSGINNNLKVVDVDNDFTVAMVGTLLARRTGSSWSLFIGRGSNKAYGFKIDAFNDSDGYIEMGQHTSNRAYIRPGTKLRRDALQLIWVTYEAVSGELNCYINTEHINLATVQKGNLAGVDVYNGEDAIIELNASTATNKPNLYGHIYVFSGIQPPNLGRLVHRDTGHLATDTLRRACVAHYMPDRQGLKLWDMSAQYNYLKENLQKYPPDNLSNFSTSSAVSYDAADDRLSFYAPDSATINSTSSVRMEALRPGNAYRVEVDVENYEGGQLEVRLNSRMSQNRNPVEGTNVYYFTQNRYSYEVSGQPSFTSRNGGRFDITRYKIIPLTEPMIDPYHADLINFTPEQVDTAAGTNTAYLDFYNKTILRPFVDSDQDGTPDQPLVEQSSFLPPLVNALQFDASQSQYASVANFNPTKEQGYTFVWSGKLDSTSANNVFFWKISGNNFVGFRSEQGATFGIRIYYGRLFLTPTLNNNSASDFHQYVISIDTGAVIKLYIDGGLIYTGQGDPTKLLGFDEVPVNATLNDLNAGGQCAQQGIAKGIITPRQVIELWNNSLLANPKSTWRNLDWQLLPNSNSIQDDGAGNYTLADNSPQNHTITLSGFKAANLDPQDPAYALTPINSLR